MSKLFICSCNNIEHLQSKEIMADSAEDAKKKYVALWEEGMILVCSNELVISSKTSD